MNSFVVIRFGALGDTLMLTPVFRYLARATGQPVGFLGKAPWSRYLLQGQPGLGGVLQIQSKRVPMALNRDKRAAAAWLREQRHSMFLDLESDAVSGELLQAADIQRERVLRIQDLKVDYRPRHQVHGTLARARAAVEGRSDLTDLDTALELAIPRQWRVDAKAWLAARGWRNEELVLVAPGNKRTMSWRPYWRKSNRKHWSLDLWVQLCSRILDSSPAARLLIVGAPAEQRLARIIADRAGHDRIHAVADDMPTTRMLALMSRARGAITLDSGPAHAAAAVDCPVVTLFNATDPARFLPLSRSGRVRAVLSEERPIGDWRPGPIEVDQVLAAWHSLQAEAASPVDAAAASA